MGPKDLQLSGEERVMNRTIHEIRRRQYLLRQRYLDMDVRRNALVQDLSARLAKRGLAYDAQKKKAGQHLKRILYAAPPEGITTARENRAASDREVTSAGRRPTTRSRRDRTPTSQLQCRVR